MQNQQTREMTSTRKTSHTGEEKKQRPGSPTVTLTENASKIPETPPEVQPQGFLTGALVNSLAGLLILLWA